MRVKFNLSVLIGKLENKIAKTFLESIRDAKQSVIRKSLDRALGRGNIEAVFETLEIDRSLFYPVQSAVQEVFEQAGKETAEHLPNFMPRNGGPGTGARIVSRWDGSNPRAVETVRRLAGDKIVGNLIQEQKDLIREVIMSAQLEGRPIREISNQLIGVRNPKTGRLEGGIIGLSPNQRGYVVNLRQELSGVPRSSYFDRNLRDKRLDGIVRRAIAAGKPLSRADQEKIVGVYGDRLLKHRAQTIARTETMTAVHMAQAEGMQQQIDSGKIPASAVTKVWSATMDNKTRASHRHMNGQSVPWEEPFVNSKTGARLMFPSDDSQGAPASEIINCRCYMNIRVDRYAALRAKERGI